jgi:hypothetical protein
MLSRSTQSAEAEAEAEAEAVAAHAHTRGGGRWQPTGGQRRGLFASFAGGGGVIGGGGCAAARQRAPLARMHSKPHQPPTTPCLYLASPARCTSHFVVA